MHTVEVRATGSRPQRVIAAMEEAVRNGQAAVTIDGKMVDYDNLRMIRRLMSFKGQVS